ncbi:MAG: Ig-like domain-containing protein [Mycobacterium sp.]
MNAGFYVGRLGPLAAALGVGAAILAGPGVAFAAPPGSDSASSSSEGQQAGAGTRPGRRAAATAATPAPAAATHRRTAARPARPTAATVASARIATEAGSRITAPAAATAPPTKKTASATAAAADPFGDFFSGIVSTFFNQSPAANPVQIGQGPTGVVTGSLNATDADSSPLSYSVTTGPAHGTVAVDAAGAYTYTPDDAVAATGGIDSFTVSISDAGTGFHLHGLEGLINLLTFGLIGSSRHVATAAVSVTVAPFTTGNTDPTGTARIDITDPSTGVVTGRVIGQDADGDAMTFTGSTSTAKGAVTVAPAGTFTYTPTVAARRNAAAPGATDADKSDTFTVTVSDSRGGAADVIVTVPVTPSSNPDPDPNPNPDPGTPLAAFPGAEGFGAYATGGRGGSVVYVTNLNADGPGSLQWAVDQPGAKYILFKVSGLIDTQIHLTNGDVTIAGQTSPGGITVRGFVTDETPYQDQAVQAPADFAQNWILQHIRIRPGLTGPSDDGLRIRYTRNAIVDHVSIGNAADEAIEISYSHDITVQNTIIAETVGSHSFFGGVLMNYSNPAYGFGLDNVSLHHNVFNRIEGRLPEGSRESLAAAGSYINLEMSNNLYWDPNFFVALGLTTNSLTDGSGNPYPIYWNLNAVNNFFQTRADFPYGMFDDQIMRTPLNHLYVSGNKMNLYPARSDYQLFYCCNDYPAVTDPNTGAQVADKLPARHPFPSITYTPTDQLRTVLLNNAGAWPRDPMDIRLMRNVADTTIAPDPRNINPAGDALLPAYGGSAPAAPTDTDSDGMPDGWEVAHGTDPNAANTNAHTLSGAGYTDLEVYLQNLSASRVTGSAL